MQEMSASPDLNDRVIRALKDRGLVRSEVAKPQASTVLNAL